MCGIAGLWHRGRGASGWTLPAAVRRMTRALASRGPDDEGYFEEVTSGIALGHRRLSIVDLSPLGHQPMFSPSGRYVTVYNGEIYNHNDMRKMLLKSGFQFRGRSDTEVLLAAVEHWGIQGAIARFIGMFAFALWDRQEQRLVLVRDRLGIKPLYYGWVGQSFVFGSELNALRRVPQFDNQINRDAVALLLRHSYIPAPFSIYQNIYKLRPGTTLSLDAAMVEEPLPIDVLTARSNVYWSAREIAERGAESRSHASPDEAADSLDSLLRDSIALRMEADVPLGAFLSGGVDSSLIVALMQAQSFRPIKTFTIGFHESDFDEAPHARTIARQLGTEHSELYVTPHEAMEIIPRLPTLFSEPFSDSSQIPTFLVSELARRHVTVSLSGDGGDELFCGYDRYFWAQWLWERFRLLPWILRSSLGRGMARTPGVWGAVLERAKPLLPHKLRVKNPTDKMARLGALIRSESSGGLYTQLISHWLDATSMVLGSRELPTLVTDLRSHADLSHFMERMMYIDLVSYLPDDILTKVDRASMAVSLEARVPLLDHRVVEFSWQLPMDLKTRDGQGKWLLRKVLSRYLPQSLFERRKQGFGVPIGSWLRGPLRDWAEALLDERRLRREGFFEPNVIRSKWMAHLRGQVDEQYRLWDVLMFQAWLETQDDSADSVREMYQADRVDIGFK